MSFIRVNKSTIINEDSIYYIDINPKQYSFYYKDSISHMLEVDANKFDLDKLSKNFIHITSVDIINVFNISSIKFTYVNSNNECFITVFYKDDDFKEFPSTFYIGDITEDYIEEIMKHIEEVQLEYKHVL